MINREDTNDHKLQYFLNSLRRRVTNWFAKYETTHPMATWGEVQRDFINWFSEIRNEGLTAATLRYAKQKKYEFIDDYYDIFLKLCMVIP